MFALAVDGSAFERPLAGIGTYSREILRALLEARPGVSATVWMRPGITVPLPPRAAARVQPATPLVGRHLLWPRRLRRTGADLYFGPAGVLPLAATGLPAVVTAHDMAIYRHPEWFPGRQPLSVRLVVPRSMRRSDVVICVSESTRADVAELFGVPASRLAVIPEGVSPAFRRLPPEHCAALRERLRLPERFLLFLSTIEPRKNLDTLLEAWARMRDRPPLVVAGAPGWACETTVQRARDLGALLVGPVPTADLPALYSLAHCLAHPAWFEGFGLTPLEAMACGTPVVCSSSSSLPEVTAGAALLVDPADVEGWTRALERVFGDAELAGNMRRTGVLRAAELTWDTAAERTWRVLESVSRRAAA